MIIEPYILIMELMQEYVYNLHEEGYSDLCETYSNKFNEPWCCVTNGIISAEDLTIVKRFDSDNLLCLIDSDTFGLVPLSYIYTENKFWETLLDTYAFNLGYENGLIDFSLELEDKNIELILKNGPITITRPFYDYGYFEHKSTISKSKKTLQDLIKNKKTS